MFLSSRLGGICLWFATVSLALAASPEIVVQGVSNESFYSSQRTITVVAEPGYDDVATLNGLPMATGVQVQVADPNFYKLDVTRTANIGGIVTEKTVLFIIRSSERGSAESGLPVHVPLPTVNSSSREFTDGNLRLLAPSRFPDSLSIPVAAFIENSARKALRVNGSLQSTSHADIQIRRGVGSGFLSGGQSPGTLNYSASIQGLQSSRSIIVEQNTTWTTSSGILGADTVWPADSRIHVTADLTISEGTTLTVGEGTIVRLDEGVSIIVDGTTTINGSLANPVVFTPNSPSNPWGGFQLLRATSALTATAAIFTGSGEDQNWIDDNGYGSHRDEECLFFLDSTPTLQLTDCAMFDLAGQWSHANNGGTLTLDRCLVQRCSTGGEFTGASFSVNDSAFIECPVDSGIYEDGDNDGLYIVSGTHGFTNTLFGWTKDDGIDAGGSGAGVLNLESCWFEATFHEGIAGSGTDKLINVYNSVFLNCGQAYEAGYNSPVISASQCLSINNLTGARYGDNYDWNYGGSTHVTNSIILNNYRDLFSYDWDSWSNRLDRLEVINTYLTTADPNYPSTITWNPATDAELLVDFRRSPIDRVGVALAAWPHEASYDQLSKGIPVRLSSFSTSEVRVDYSMDCSDGDCTDGTLIFTAGETLQFIPVPEIVGVVRCELSNPINADLTGASAMFLNNLSPLLGNNTTLVAQGSSWKYLDDGSDQGSAWTSLAFDDSGWKEGLAEFGYGDGDEATVINSDRTDGSRILTTYFRHDFDVDDPTVYGELTIRFRRDDGGVVYLNGVEVFRSNMPGGVIQFDTPAASTTPSNQEAEFRITTINSSLLNPGANVISAEVHQRNTTSSDVSFELDLVAAPANSGSTLFIRRLGSEVVPYWGNENWILEEATSLLGPWQTSPSSNAQPLQPGPDIRYFRLRN